MWPDKPSVNDANRWYQVKYGLTDPQNLSTVSIAVGTVAESYINFGWFGPLLIIFPLGIFLGSFERIFLHADSGVLFSCLGAVLVPQLLAIEAQMAQYVAGLAQQIALVLLVLIPTLELRAQAGQLRRLVPLPYPAKRGMQKNSSPFRTLQCKVAEQLGNSCGHEDSSCESLVLPNQGIRSRSLQLWAMPRTG